MKPGTKRGIPSEILRLLRSWFAILKSKPQPFSFTIASLFGLLLSAGGTPSIQITIKAGLLAYFISTSIYILNDALEVHIDKVNIQGRAKRPLTTGEAAVYDALALSGLTGALGLVLAAYLSNLTLLLAALAFILGVAYSAPKIYLKKRFPHKTVVMTISASLAPLTGASYYGLFNLGIVAAVGITSSYIVAMAIINDFRDLEGDRAFGVRTIPLVLGPSTSLLLMRGVFVLIGVLVLLMNIFHRLSQVYTFTAVLGLAASIIITLPLTSSYSKPIICRKVLKKIRFLHFCMQLNLLTILI